jgi:hypothetical protein
MAPANNSLKPSSSGNAALHLSFVKMREDISEKAGIHSETVEVLEVNKTDFFREALCELSAFQARGPGVMSWDTVFVCFSNSAPWRIKAWQRIRVSSRFAGVGEVVAELMLAFVDFEDRPIDFNNFVAIHVFDLRHFPTHGELSYSGPIFLNSENVIDSPYSQIYRSTVELQSLRALSRTARLSGDSTKD